MELTIEQALERAVQAHKAGNLQDAESLYRAILQSQPKHPDANHNLGILAVSVNRADVALPLFKNALDANPRQGQFWISYIDALIKEKQFDNAQNILEQSKKQGLVGQAVDALAAQLLNLAPTSRGSESEENKLSVAIELRESGKYQESQAWLNNFLKTDPNNAQAWSLLSQVYLLDKKDNESEKALLTAVSINPDLPSIYRNQARLLLKKSKPAEALIKAQSGYERSLNDPESWLILATCLAASQRDQEALNLIERTLKARPNYAEAFATRALIRLRAKNIVDAITDLEKAVSLKQHLAQLWRLLGNLRYKTNNLPGAIEALYKAHEYDASNADFMVDLGELLRQDKKVSEAIIILKEATHLAPKNENAWINLGVALQQATRIDEAKVAFENALEINPNSAEVASNLGAIAKDAKDLETAKKYFEKAIEIKPDLAEARNNLGMTLQDLSRLDEAQASYKRALKLNPNLSGTHSNLIYCLSMSEGVGAQELAQELGCFAKQFEEPLQSSWPIHDNVRDARRTLRVGFVSADFRHHAVASYIEPVLVHLVRDTQLSLYAYYNYVTEDNVTERLKGLFASWANTASLSDEALAQKVRDDGIDILIDLSSHTADNRLLTFARKPAPVQVSWIGYPGSTGLHSMDYFLSDKHALPEGQFEDQFTEKIVRLPAAATFLPFKGSPPVNDLPAAKNDYLTFGSFNRPNKISRSVIALWSELLRAIPNARMVLGSMPEEGQHNVLLQWFTQEGIGAERLSLYPMKPLGEYLALHHEVDVCLDTFPYNGGTTTWHAIWMGVPTLTLAGQTVAGRSGASILGQVGLESFVAQSKEEFVQTGQQLAREIKSLAQIRAGMRSRFEQSAAGNPQVVAAGLTQAMRVMWQRWCNDLPAQAFSVNKAQ